MSSIVTFYCGDPKNAPKTTIPAHLGANAILTWNGRLLTERRRDADVWGLVGGGAKKWETGRQAIAREVCGPGSEGQIFDCFGRVGLLECRVEIKYCVRSHVWLLLRKSF